MPKRYTSRELIKLAEDCGWRLTGVKETITTSNIRQAGLSSQSSIRKKMYQWGAPWTQ